MWLALRSGSSRTQRSAFTREDESNGEKLAVVAENFQKFCTGLKKVASVSKRNDVDHRVMAVLRQA